MIIQYIFSASLFLLTIYGLSQRRKSPLVAMAIVLLTILGNAFVWFPEMTNTLAHAVGIGRGADLILYCFMIIALAAILNLHLRIRGQQDIVTRLVREIALSQAQDGAPDRRAERPPETP